ncbi:hypothetical protein J421_1444 [Gemmatirosa kalamazoonensis]|uniref:Uncharacterized protein n=1 Tax=Gemmatirosa kalamazoonensis TaxID=861299 RepID=W0RDU9_9BACT|nr:hypothetical protein [Gemmatirosa kalamazoonensis]AHG88981.1 hypothetical protein J421_1444 [Gemmatirosa kalamazoonensis]
MPDRLPPSTGDSHPMPDDETPTRVDAALSLASRPPADLLARIQARRRAGDQVELPVVDDETETPADAHLRAALSLMSRPPDDVLGRAAARRAAGERVLLPTVPAPRRRWRWIAGPLGVAAVALLTVRVARDPAIDRSAAQQRRADVASPSLPPSGIPKSNVPPSIVPPSVVPPSIVPPSVVPRPARSRAVTLPVDSAAADSSTVAVALDSTETQLVDSIARALRGDDALRVEIRYTDPSFRRTSSSWRLLQLAKDRLLAAGVAEERIRAVRVPATRGPIEVVTRTR